MPCSARSASVRPEAVVHCAAWTAVDACEADPDRAFAHNALAVRWVAEGCRRFGSHLVQLSTDYVFSGEKAEPYVEWDPTGPLSVYGASKLAGEHEAMGAGIGATIVRTSWVVGEHGQNMVKTILRLLAERPTSVLRRRSAGPSDLHRRPGRDGCAGWRWTADRASTTSPTKGRSAGSSSPGRSRRRPAVIRPRCEPIATKDLHPPRPAPRPANSVLDNAVLRLSGLPLLPDFRETLPKVVRAIVDGA